MKIKYIYISLIAALFVFNACDQSLLDIEQQAVSSEDNFYQTDEDAEQAVAAVYAKWRNTEFGRGSGSAFYSNGFMIRNYLSDELNSGGSRSDQPSIQEMNESVVASTNPWIETYYEGLYSTIYLANLVIEKFEAESATKELAIAEAKFFRAYSHFQLTTLWGTPPLVDHVLLSSEYEIGNSTSEELWAFIESDLNDAIDAGVLPSKTGLDDKETGLRITQEAAKAFLGKVYLFEEKYSQAKSMFQDVISSDNYGLEDDISVFYHASGNYSKEYLFEANRHYDMNNGYVQAGWMGILWNWSFAYGITAGPEASQYYDFNSTVGYSNGMPPKELYDDFVAEEGVDGYRLKNTIVSWDQMVAMNIYTISTLNIYMNQGYWRMKWLTRTEDENVSYWTGNLASTPAMRYADVLLMMAEACVKTGDANADTYFNMVRTRAQLPTKSSVTMSDIKLERHLELAMEGVRFQDLIRWGDAATALANKGKSLPTFHVTPVDASSIDASDPSSIYNAEYETSITTIDNENTLSGWTPNRDELLPFPEAEMEVNSNLVQNPGYGNN